MSQHHWRLSRAVCASLAPHRWSSCTSAGEVGPVETLRTPARRSSVPAVLLRPAADASIRATAAYFDEEAPQVRACQTCSLFLDCLEKFIQRPDRKTHGLSRGRPRNPTKLAVRCVFAKPYGRIAYGLVRASPSFELDAHRDARRSQQHVSIFVTHAALAKFHGRTCGIEVKVLNVTRSGGNKFKVQAVTVHWQREDSRDAGAAARTEACRQLAVHEQLEHRLWEDVPPQTRKQRIAQLESEMKDMGALVTELKRRDVEVGGH